MCETGQFSTWWHLAYTSLSFSRQRSCVTVFASDTCPEFDNNVANLVRWAIRKGPALPSAVLKSFWALRRAHFIIAMGGCSSSSMSGHMHCLKSVPSTFVRDWLSHEFQKKDKAFKRYSLGDHGVFIMFLHFFSAFNFRLNIFVSIVFATAV